MLVKLCFFYNNVEDKVEIAQTFSNKIKKSFVHYFVHKFHGCHDLVTCFQEERKHCHTDSKNNAK